MTERDVKESDAFKIWQRMRQTINNVRNVRRAKQIWRVRVTIETKHISNHGSKGKHSNKGTLVTKLNNGYISELYRVLHSVPIAETLTIFVTYEGWNFNSGNYLFTTDTK